MMLGACPIWRRLHNKQALRRAAPSGFRVFLKGLRSLHTSHRHVMTGSTHPKLSIARNAVIKQWAPEDWSGSGNWR